MRTEDEIACDESGWEGANLVTGGSDVIAYASVRLSVDAAVECLRALGVRASYTRREYKASHVLRADRRTVLTSLLGVRGPIHGNGFVHLTDKVCFVVGRLLDLLLGQSAEAATLIREGPEAFGRDGWRAFLAVSNGMLRERKPRSVREPVDAFFDTVGALRAEGRLGALLDELRGTRPVAYAVRERLLERHVLRPALEPLIPALCGTVLHWSRGGETDVSIVHDEQSALTERRIRLIERQLLPPGRRLHFRQVDSRTDPRVQVADVLAGVARKLASDELAGRGDAVLATLLRPYVDPASCWSDERSWSRLGPAR